MSWLDLVTKNSAELSLEADDHDLQPVIVTLPPVHAVTWTRGILDGLPRWSVVAAYEQNGMIHAIHRTRFWRLVDDVHIGFEPHSAGTRIVARSQSRIGKADLGQNKRNLRELTRALRHAEAARLARLQTGTVRPA